MFDNELEKTTVFCYIPKAVFFPSLTNISVKHNGKDDDQNDGNGSSTGNASSL